MNKLTDCLNGLLIWNFLFDLSWKFLLSYFYNICTYNLFTCDCYYLVIVIIDIEYLWLYRMHFPLLVVGF